MDLLEFLDRAAERRARHRDRPRDIRQFIGFAFLCGYYLLVYQFATRDVPGANLDLIRDAMLTLGPPVGLIVGAMFRSDVRDEQATANTGKAFEAVKAAAQAGVPESGEAARSADEACDDCQRSAGETA